MKSWTNTFTSREATKGDGHTARNTSKVGPICMVQLLSAADQDSNLCTKTCTVFNYMAPASFRQKLNRVNWSEAALYNLGIRYVGLECFTLVSNDNFNSGIRFAFLPFYICLRHFVRQSSSTPPALAIRHITRTALQHHTTRNLPLLSSGNP